MGSANERLAREIIWYSSFKR